MYLVIVRDEDEPTLRFFQDKSAFLQWMDERSADGEEFGFTEFLACTNPNLHRLSFDSFPARTAIVFKGDIVIPFATQVVKSFDVP